MLSALVSSGAGMAYGSRREGELRTRLSVLKPGSELNPSTQLTGTLANNGVWKTSPLFLNLNPPGP